MKAEILQVLPAIINGESLLAKEQEQAIKGVQQIQKLIERKGLSTGELDEARTWVQQIQELIKPKGLSADEQDEVIKRVPQIQELIERGGLPVKGQMQANWVEQIQELIKRGWLSDTEQRQALEEVQQIQELIEREWLSPAEQEQALEGVRQIQELIESERSEQEGASKWLKQIQGIIERGGLSANDLEQESKGVEPIQKLIERGGLSDDELEEARTWVKLILESIQRGGLHDDEQERASKWPKQIIERGELSTIEQEQVSNWAKPIQKLIECGGLSANEQEQVRTSVNQIQELIKGGVLSAKEQEQASTWVKQIQELIERGGLSADVRKQTSDWVNRTNKSIEGESLSAAKQKQAPKDVQQIQELIKSLELPKIKQWLTLRKIKKIPKLIEGRLIASDKNKAVKYIKKIQDSINSKDLPKEERETVKWLEKLHKLIKGEGLSTAEQKQALKEVQQLQELIEGKGLSAAEQEQAREGVKQIQDLIKRGWLSAAEQKYVRTWAKQIQELIERKGLSTEEQEQVRTWVNQIQNLIKRKGLSTEEQEQVNTCVKQIQELIERGWLSATEQKQARTWVKQIQKRIERKGLSAEEQKQVRWFARGSNVFALGFYFLLALIFFFEVIFSGKTYESPDAQTATALATQLQKKESLPLWSPYIFCGMPSFASLMYAPFVYMPSFVLQFLFKELSYPLHYVFAGFGVFLFLRRKAVNLWPALLGGLAFMFTPYLVTMLVFGHGSQMMTAAYLPWALWAVDWLIEEFSSRNWRSWLNWRSVGVAGLILGFQLQRGHVQISYYILMLVGFYLLYHLITVLRQKDFERLRSILLGFSIALMLAVGLAVNLYWPLQEYTPYSIRGTPPISQAQTGVSDTGVGFEYATQWSFSPREMMTFLVPSFYGFGGQTYWGDMPFTDYPNYMGILILVLAVIALLYRRESTTRFLGWVIVIALFISFGKNEAFSIIGFVLLALWIIYLVLWILSVIQPQWTTAYFWNNVLSRFKSYKKFGTIFLLGATFLYLMIFNTSPILLYHLFYNFLPYFNKFRVPVMILIVVQMSVAILAGLGLQKLIETLNDAANDEKRKPELLKYINTMKGVIALLVLAGLIYSAFQIFSNLASSRFSQANLAGLRTDMFIRDGLLRFIVVALGFLLFGYILKNSKKSNLLALGTITITLFDLGLVDYNLNNPQPKRDIESDLKKADDTIRFLKDDTSRFRIYPIGELFGENGFAAFEIESIGGYHPAKPRAYQDLLDASRIDSDFILKYIDQGRPELQAQIPAEVRQKDSWLLDLLNVKYILNRYSYPLSGLNFDSTCTKFYKYHNQQIPLQIYRRKTLPRAYFVDSLEYKPQMSEALKRLMSNNFNPHKSVILGELSKDEFSKLEETLQPNHAATDTANITQYELDRIVIETQKNAYPHILVLSDNYYPRGWKAYTYTKIDEKTEERERPIYRANYCFRAVYVPAGTDRVEFRFESTAHIWGRRISFAALFFAMALACGGWVTSKVRGFVKGRGQNSTP